MSRWAVVLAGGVGSRFWPVSTPARPKQLLPLVNDEPMLAATLRRLRPLAPPKHTLVLTNASLTDAVKVSVQERWPRLRRLSGANSRLIRYGAVMSLTVTVHGESNARADC